MSITPILVLNLARTGDMFDFGPGPSRRYSYGAISAGKATTFGGAGTDPDHGGEMFLQIVLTLAGVILFATLVAFAAHKLL